MTLKQTCSFCLRPWHAMSKKWTLVIMSALLILLSTYCFLNNIPNMLKESGVDELMEVDQSTSRAQKGTQQGETSPEGVSLFGQKGNYKKYCTPKRGFERFNIQFSIKKQKHPPLLDGYKNPCWKGPVPRSIQRSIKSQPIWCIPYFYLAGFPKCGTSDLFFRVTMHPLIVKGKCKEPQFVSGRKEDFGEICGIDDEMGLAFRYSQNYFAGASQTILRNDYNNSKMGAWPRNSKQFEHPIITVDGSPSTMWDNHYWRFIEENLGCKSPFALSSDLVLQLNPNARFIVIMRNPTDRIYSRFMDNLLMYVSQSKHGVEVPKDYFHTMSEQIIRQYEKCKLYYPERLCVYRANELFGRDVEPYIISGTIRHLVGIYDIYIADWLERWPRDRFLFLRSESYQTDKATTLAKIFEFLELPPLTTEAMQRIASQEEQHVTSRKKRHGPMWNKTRKLLDDFYRPHNYRLARRLGDERFLWND